MSKPDPALARRTIANTLGGMVLPGRTYPGDLHPDLAPWYCYVVDSGHCIVVVIKSLIEDAPSVDHSLPTPVLQVLRHGWEVIDGWIVCDLPYDPDLGAETVARDYEF